MLKTGKYATIKEIARAEKINPSYVSRVLRLTLLAPDLVEALLHGRQNSNDVIARLDEAVPDRMGSTEMNDSRSPRRTDLQGRRRRLGATRRAMAAGIGLRVDQVTEIEEGTASDALRNMYAQWLDRLESWPTVKRASQLLAAQENLQRFRP
jgi:hypothetical protein